MNSMIIKFIANPELLLRMSIQHGAIENNDVVATWCRAIVDGIDKINGNNLK